MAIGDEATRTPLLKVRGIGKRFPGVKALDDVSMKLMPSEILAVLGENGAGKSTLMKILAGVQTADEGEFLMEGKPVSITSVSTALKEGIALIHQELNLAGNLSVAANIFLGREPTARGFIDERKIELEARQFLAKVGLDVPPNQLVEELPIGRQQMVEIAKALSVNARVLIMDEPTSSLSQREAETLFTVIKQLRDQGVSIIYISHRLGEVKALADRVCVLRDGKNAGELSREEISHDAMVRLMVGRDIHQFYQHKDHAPGKVALEVKQLRTSAHPAHEVSFSLRSGEVVGMAGLVGAGRTELMLSIFGADPPLDGEVLVDGASVKLVAPIDAIRAGIALVPEDRKQQGLILDMAVRGNVGLPSLKRESRQGVFFNEPREQELSQQAIQQMNVKTPHDRQMVRFLSGGNQQKVVLGKWLAMQPRILLLDEPTRGIDVGAKQEIYALIEQLAASGVAILFVSSEMEEIMRMSDRVLVMHEGNLTGELSRDELSEESIMQLATGNTLGAA